jgi:hypothetical protein
MLMQMPLHVGLKLAPYLGLELCIPNHNWLYCCEQ